jgi:hypothetical protein
MVAVLRKHFRHSRGTLERLYARIGSRLGFKVGLTKALGDTKFTMHNCGHTLWHYLIWT